MPPQPQGTQLGQDVWARHFVLAYRQGGTEIACLGSGDLGASMRRNGKGGRGSGGDKRVDWEALPGLGAIISDIKERFWKESCGVSAVECGVDTMSADALGNVVVTLACADSAGTLLGRHRILYSGSLDSRHAVRWTVRSVAVEPSCSALHGGAVASSPTVAIGSSIGAARLAAIGRT